MVKIMIQINIYFNSIKDLYHPFNKSTLNPTLASFIYEECFGKSAKNDIQICVSSKEILTEIEKETIINLIHNNFKNELKEEKIKNNLTSLFRTTLFLIGIIILFFVYLIKAQILHEFLLIIGWLAVWESVYDFLFVETKEKTKRKRYQKISESKIIFN